MLLETGIELTLHQERTYRVSLHQTHNWWEGEDRTLRFMKSDVKHYQTQLPSSNSIIRLSSTAYNQLPTKTGTKTTNIRESWNSTIVLTRSLSTVNVTNCLKIRWQTSIVVQSTLSITKLSTQLLMSDTSVLFASTGRPVLSSKSEIGLCESYPLIQ